jgi:hypothetical protein
MPQSPRSSPGAAAESRLGEDFSGVPAYTEASMASPRSTVARGTTAADDDFAGTRAQFQNAARRREFQKPKGKSPDPEAGKPAPTKAKGKKPDYRSRVRNVKLKLGSTPKVKLTHDDKLITLTMDNFLTATGEADVEGGAHCNDFEFGFIQLCRPLDVNRAVYCLKDSPGMCLADDASAGMRAGAPVLDVFHVGDVFSYHAKPACGARGRTHHAKVDYSDNPVTAFGMAPTDASYTQGIAWQDYFFTTFSVRYPDGTVDHLKSFYWDIHFCLQIDPPTKDAPIGKRKSMTEAVKVGDPIDGVPGEPGLGLMGKPAAKTCNAVARGAKRTINNTKSTISC